MSVGSDYFLCPRQRLLRSYARRLRFDPELKIGDRIVVIDAVLVVNILLCCEVSPEVFFHNEYMFEYVLPFTMYRPRMPFLKDHNVPILQIPSCAIVWPQFVSALYAVAILRRMYIDAANMTNHSLCDYCSD